MTRSGRIGEIYNIGGTDTVENLAIIHRVLGLMAKPESLIRYVADRLSFGQLPRIGWSEAGKLEELRWATL